MCKFIVSMSKQIKHAYIITINGNLPVVNTCLQMLDFASNDFYILCDKKWGGHKTILSNLTTLKRASVRYVDSKIINWGGYSQVSAVLQLLMAVVDSGIDYKYIHFLQGSDLPIKNNYQIIDFFEKNKGMEFINIDKSQTGHSWAEYCCKYQYFFSHNRFYRKSKLCKIFNLLVANLQRLIGIQSHKTTTFYYGSALFSITLDFAKYIISQHDQIYKLFRWSLAPDEKFIQTIFMNSPFSNNLYSEEENSIMANAYLIDWTSREHNSPKVWRISDIEQLMSQPQGVCFARKFIASVDMDVVIELKDRILNE